MQALYRWRSLLILKDTATASTLKTYLADFHYSQWRNKWTCANKKSTPPPDERSSQTPTKETYSETDTMSDPPKNKDRSKSSHAARHAAKVHHKRMKRKQQRAKLHLDYDDRGSIFQETLRKRGCTWSYWSFQESFHQSSTPGFDFFKQHVSWSHKKKRESDIESEEEPEPEPYAESCIYGTISERKVLGLPLKGPVSIQDVKNSFRLSALKWHPDKHQGPAQAAAEEKFKLCVDAYNTLCQSLSASVNR